MQHSFSSSLEVDYMRKSVPIIETLPCFYGQVIDNMKQPS